MEEKLDNLVAQIHFHKSLVSILKSQIYENDFMMSFPKLLYAMDKIPKRNIEKESSTPIIWKLGLCEPESDALMS